MWHCNICAQFDDPIHSNQICKFNTLITNLAFFKYRPFNDNPYYVIYPLEGILICFTEQGIPYGELSVDMVENTTNNGYHYWEGQIRVKSYFEQIYHSHYEVSKIQNELNKIFASSQTASLAAHGIFLDYGILFNHIQNKHDN